MSASSFFFCATVTLSCSPHPPVASERELDLSVPLPLLHRLAISLHLCRFHSLVIDVTMALDTLSLPVLEPLTPARLQDVTVLALSCLYAGEPKADISGRGCVVGS